MVYFIKLHYYIELYYISEDEVGLHELFYFKHI